MPRVAIRPLIAAAFRAVRRDHVGLVLLAIGAGSVWLFSEVADTVAEGEANAIDRAVLASLRAGDGLGDPIGPRWVEEMARDITALGGLAVLVLVTSVVVGYLLLERARRAAGLVLVAVLGASLTSSALKDYFGRARPELSDDVYVVTASFPSGHSMLAAATYLTLAVLVARRTTRRTGVFFVSVGVVVTLLVGVSRMYLGVHWPTDVLAGWSLGAAWAVSVAALDRFVYARPRAE